MAGFGGLGGSLAEALFTPSPERPFPDRPMPPPPATPGLMDQLRQWLRGQGPAADVEAASLAPDVFPIERPPPEDLRSRAFPDRPEATTAVTPEPAPRDPFWEVMWPGVQKMGSPIQGARTSGLEEGPPTGPLASPYERAEGLAQFAGSALPGRGGVGPPKFRKPVPAPNEPALVKAYAGGQGKPWWYEGSPEAFRRMYGSEENLSRGFNAILSQQKNPTEQARLANQAMRFLHEYGIGGLERMPVMGSQKKELQAMADFFKFNPKADLAQVLSPTSLKRRDYYWTFGGRGDRPVIDRHMGDILYPPGEFKAASGARMVELYTNASDITNALAQRAGVPGSQYQGAAWIGHRLAKGLTKDNEPFAEILRRVGEQSPDYQWLLKQGRLEGVSAEGLRNLQIVLPLAGLALAGALGMDVGKAEAAEAEPEPEPALATGGRQRLVP
jgi:hypothetical protein